MQEIFLKLLNMSITAAWVVLAVLALRLVFRRSPKWIHCLLWSVVALRLLIPVSLESKLSLIPESEPISQEMVQSTPQMPDVTMPEVQQENFPEQKTEESKGKLLPIAATVWVVGVGLMLLYSAISYLLLCRLVRASIQKQPWVYYCDQVASPFILGMFLPRIYLPSGMNPEQENYVIAHEQAHLHRRNHWWKPIGFVLLSVHWFNPVLWLAYILLCRDIEKACDERVVRNMEDAEKVDYSRALVACSRQRRLILSCSVAFGEVTVKDRVRSVLHYKKPALWLIIGGVVACAVAAVCLLTNPPSCRHEYALVSEQPASCTVGGQLLYGCRHCEDQYTEAIAVLEHHYAQEHVTKPATCTQEGTAVHTCRDCGKQETRAVEVAPHTYANAVVLTAPTCSQTGTQRVTCSVCGAQEEQTVAVNDQHEYVNTVVRAPTCTDCGEGVDTCLLCNSTRTVEYEMKNHSYQQGQVFPANCRWEGKAQMVCADCGSEYWKTIPKNEDHIWGRGINNTVCCVNCGLTKSGATTPYYVAETTGTYLGTSSGAVNIYDKPAGYPVRPTP